MGVRVQRLVQHLHDDLRSLDDVERLYDGHVEQAIGHGCLRGDIEVVAVLRGIAACDEEGFVVFFLPVKFEFVGFRFVGESTFQGVLNVSNQSSLSAGGEFLADEGIESHAASAEERYVVDDAVVQSLDVASCEHLQCLVRIHGNLYVACKSVSAAHGYDGECRLCVTERASDLVDSPIASDSGADIEGVLGCL